MLYLDLVLMSRVKFRPRVMHHCRNLEEDSLRPQPHTVSRTCGVNLLNGTNGRFRDAIDFSEPVLYHRGDRASFHRGNSLLENPCDKARSNSSLASTQVDFESILKLYVTYTRLELQNEHPHFIINISYTPNRHVLPPLLVAQTGEGDFF